MKRTWIFFMIVGMLSALHAEEYTIWFNSSTGDGNATDKFESLVYMSTDNCAQSIIKAVKIARAKEGYGIKGGTGSIGGHLILGLNTTYAITSMTVYAAAYPNKQDTITPINVCGTQINWAIGAATVIMPYDIAAPGEIDNITIDATKEKNNRFYIQKIVFTAKDPFPGVAKITLPPSLDFGGAIVVDGEPATDATDITIIAHETTEDDLQLRLKNGKYFILDKSTLPHNGGELNIAYIVKSATDKGFPVTDSLIITAKGKNAAAIRAGMELKLYAKNYTTPTFDVDSSCMHIGKMPSNYYQPAQGLQDSALKSALSEIIHCGVRYKYGSGFRKSWDAFYHTDRDCTTQQVFDMYSNKVRYFDATDTCASVAEMDIEHMLPKSWWGGFEANVSAACDLYHLSPSDYSANRSKSNHAPGIPSDSSFNNGSFVTGSGSPYGLQRVFCPDDEYKGDFARAYFYVVTCYEEIEWVTTGEPGKSMTNNSYLEFQPWLQNLLISWHRLDPVSEREKSRAAEVNKIQGNRNPFIDFPELAEYIWGEKQGVTVNFYNLTQSYGDSYSEEDTALSQPTTSTTASKRLDGDLVILQKDGKKYTILGNFQE